MSHQLEAPLWQNSRINATDAAEDLAARLRRLPTAENVPPAVAGIAFDLLSLLAECYTDAGEAELGRACQTAANVGISGYIRAAQAQGKAFDPLEYPLEHVRPMGVPRPCIAAYCGKPASADSPYCAEHRP